MRTLFSLVAPISLVLAACGSVPGDTATDTVTQGDTSTDPTATETATATDTSTSTAADPTEVPTTGAPTTDATTSTSATATDTGDTTTTDTGDPGVPTCGDPVHFASDKEPTQVVHVAPDGVDDPLSCGTLAAPCQTLGAAVALASPGTAIRLHPGTYAADEFIEELAGTEDAPIWIGGVPGEERPVISGGTEALHLSRVRHLVLHDLEVTGASGNGINVDDGGLFEDPEATRFVVFERVFIHDIGDGGNQDCLKLSGLNDFWILGSEFTGCSAGGSAIDHVGCHRGLILDNNFSDNGGNAIQTKGGSEDIEIRGNTMTDCGQRAVNMGGSTGFEFFRPPLLENAANAEARNIRVIANVIVGGEAPLAFVGCVDCLAANNTIVRPQHWLLRILQETVSNPAFEFEPVGNSRFINNVVVFDRNQISNHVNIGPDTAAETFTFASNLWFAADQADQSSPAGDLPVAETDPIVGVDPGLVDLDGDFHLTPGSPAVHSGMPLAELTGDRDHQCWADPPSRGAFELVE
ncbi:right-handed parallel beta-helix repeat-containing protein [Nannocystis sp. SCPEA4]|uniref:right-handed parallel beta-helix repeat-containing protein n=1 Tax=Nannocystis sp. SCPEA4 TaxID=2996787 RepID=UPI002271394A|nr:right-handed parallel beta-helix repeat-containing protein [Nannocystis sp. SCPEA4]MCY1062089.1 right-handed parallel beta-helix repeat-containing protein [Nannocystis sp. SCPEA4]